LVGISLFFFLLPAFGLEHSLQARSRGLNVFLFDGVRPLLEAVENLYYLRPSRIQNPIPGSGIRLAQFVNALPYSLHRFPVRRSLAELQAVQGISEVTLDAIREALQYAPRIALKNERN
jgi:hypothetical protein